VPVRFILDEFANTCVIPNFVKILAYARSFGIGIVTILQSLEQIKKMYEKEWGVIIDNSNYLLYLGAVTHMETLEYISKLLGKGTFDKRSSSRTYGKSGSSSKNWDTLGRELLLPDEIRMMPKDKCLLIAGGRKPFYSTKYDYTQHPNYALTSDGGAGSYDYKPKLIGDGGLSIDDIHSASFGNYPHGEDMDASAYELDDGVPYWLEDEIKMETSVQGVLKSLRGKLWNNQLVPFPDELMGDSDYGDDSYTHGADGGLEGLIDGFRVTDRDGSKGDVDSVKLISAVTGPLEMLANTLASVNSLEAIPDELLTDDFNADDFVLDDGDVGDYSFDDGEDTVNELMDDLIDVLAGMVDGGGAGAEVA
jgi:hypothetical protein